MVLESVEGDLVRVLLTHVQIEPSNGHRLKLGQDATTGHVSNALAVEVDVVSAVALLHNNLPKRRLESRRQRLLEGIEHTLIERGKITFQF